MRAGPVGFERVPGVEVGAGYDAAQVDDLLDRVRARLVVGEPLDDLLEASLPGPGFAGSGYDAAAVDALLARLGGRPVAPASMQPLPEEPGLFARLFGRR